MVKQEKLIEKLLYKQTQTKGGTMPKTLEEYIREFGDHLHLRDKSSKTIESYTIAVKQLLCDEVGNNPSEWILKRHPETLTLSDVEDFAYKVRKEYQPNSQKIKLCAIKRYLIFCKKAYKNTTYNDYLIDKEETEDILKADVIQDKKIDILTKDEIKMFFDASEENPRDNAIFKTFYYTTQRVYSIQNLNIQDVDFTPRTTTDGREYYNITFKYQKGKNKKAITIAVELELIKAIQTYLDVREEPDKEGFIYDNYGKKLYHRDAVFLNGTGQRFTCMGIFSMMKRYAVRLKIKKPIHPHTFRHSAITHMDKAGLSDAMIKLRSGHAKRSNALDIYKDPRVDDVFTDTEKALALQPESELPKPEQPKPQPSENIEIRIKELELELMKLKEKKEQKEQDKLNYYG